LASKADFVILGNVIPKVSASQPWTSALVN